LPARESLQGFSASFIRRWMPEPWRGICLRFFSGLAYALVMMQKKFRGADFESSLLVSCALSAAIGIPFYGQESEMSLHIWFFVLLLGVVQFGLSYVFLSRGLDAVVSCHGVADLDDRADLKSGSGGCFLWGDNRCNRSHRCSAGGRFGDGLTM